MEIVLAILGSSALAAIISGIFGLLVSRQHKENGVAAGVRILLYERIKFLGTHYVEKGYVSNDDYEDLLKMHRAYHNPLKGNGFLDDIMEQVKKLPRHN